MCILTICSVEYVFSCRNVDLVFSFYFLSNSLLKIQMDSHCWIFMAPLGLLVDTRCLQTWRFWIMLVWSLILMRRLVKDNSLDSYIDRNRDKIDNQCFLQKSVESYWKHRLMLQQMSWKKLSFAWTLQSAEILSNLAKFLTQNLNFASFQFITWISLLGHATLFFF